MRALTRFSLVSCLALILAAGMGMVVRQPAGTPASEPAAPAKADTRVEAAVDLPPSPPRWDLASANFPTELGEFAAWARDYLAADPLERPGLLATGRELAQARRTCLRELIRTDPAAALAAAIPYEVRAELPAEFAALLEVPVSGVGEYLVAIACGDRSAHDHAGEPCGDDHGVSRSWEVAGSLWQAFPYGNRRDTTTKLDLAAHGIGIDGWLAMDANPVRILTAAEALARGLAGPGIPVEIAGRLQVLPDDAALHAWIAALQADERRLGPHPGPALRATRRGDPLPPLAASEGTAAAPAGEPEVAESAWTEGTKSFLYIRARFADEAADFEPIALSTVQAHQTAMDQYLRDASYGKLAELNTTFTTVVTLPKNASDYSGGTSQALASLLTDARAAAKNANTAWDTTNFNFDAVVTSNKGNFPYAGVAYVGQKGMHLRSDFTSLRTAGHEFGHNLGLWHANYWRTNALSPIGRDAVPGGYVRDTVNAEWIEYGHRFSLMSAQSGTDFDNASRPHFAVSEKFRLDWLTTAAGVQSLTSTPATGTVVRLYRQDHPSAPDTRGLRIDVPSSDYTESSSSAKRRYWLSYRRAFTSGAMGTFSPFGVQVDWQRNSYGGDGAVMLDMTPYTVDSTTYFDGSNPNGWWTIDNGDKEDGQLPIGLTYSDPAGIHITPIAHGDLDGTTNNGNEWIEVDVRVGTFPENRPPVVTLTASNPNPNAGQAITLTASASDPDGDTLSYWWDFGDRSVVASALNQPAATKSWSSAGVRVVRLVVSDRRGGRAVAQLPITVGLPANTAEIRGRVLHGGYPVEGARVYVGTTYQTWTDSEGRYLLVGLPSGSFTIASQFDGLTFTPQFANPVSTASGNVYGRDFFSNERFDTAATAYSLSGRVSTGGSGLAGIAVEASGLRTVTDASGNYTFANLVPGTYTVRPLKAGRNYSPASRVVTLSSGNANAQDFAEARFTVTGRVTGVPSAQNNNTPPAVFLLDGTQASTSKVRNQGWDYTLAVPAGTWSLHSTYPNYAVTPGFTNPLGIAGNLSGQGFSGSSDPSNRSLSGRVMFGANGLPGVTITASGGFTGSTITDSEGRYRFDNLGSASVTLSAMRDGFAFTTSPGSANPVSPTATVDFTVTAAASPLPQLSGPVTSTTTLAGPGSVELAVSATGQDPLTFHWAATSGSGAVTFSSNDSTAAAATTASFTASGTYACTVFVTDASGFTSSAAVSVTVLGTDGVLALSPYEVVINAGETTTFTTTLFDLSGAPTPAAPSYSVSGGGTIGSANGIFTGTRSGTHTVTATHEGLTATATVTVIGDLEVATFDDWLAIEYPSLTGADADPLADPDGDGVPNLLEYALGGNPTDPDDSPLPDSVLVFGTEPEALPHVQLRFLRARSELTYLIEASSDMLDWEVIATNPGEVGESVEVTDPEPVIPANPRFLRLRVR